MEGVYAKFLSFFRDRYGNAKSCIPVCLSVRRIPPRWPNEFSVGCIQSEGPMCTEKQDPLLRRRGGMRKERRNSERRREKRNPEWYDKSRRHPRVCFAEFPGSLRYRQTDRRRKKNEEIKRDGGYRRDIGVSLAGCAPSSSGWSMTFFFLYEYILSLITDTLSGSAFNIVRFLISILFL